jgi:predicted nucleotidyltransferase
MSTGILELNEIIKTVTTLAEKYQSITKLTLVGSYAHGDATEDSDIDLIVYIEGDNHTDPYFGLFDDLENAFDKKIDLLTPDGVDESPLRESILSGGKVIYSKVRKE